ncbi:MAG: signal peptidase I [Verrucomicrobia bacterium]|nr:signal peptidase I [Verrucomicrobiota bacterium]
MNSPSSNPSTYSHWASRFLIGRNPKWTMVRVLFVMITSYILFGHILLPIRVTGISMEPNYLNGRVNFINKLAYRSIPPQRGDVVGIRTQSAKAIYMKRVVALPGEKVALRAGIVYINGQPLEEPYTKPNPSWNGVELRLKDQEYLVIGDNRTMRMDQHDFGTTDITQFVGRVLF